MAEQQKIVPNLWCDGNAREAAEFYCTVFPDAVISNITHYPTSREEGLADFQLAMAGKELTAEFQVAGYSFVAINAGPEFKPNPSISFFVNFDPSRIDNPRGKLASLWEKLYDGGKILMELDSYPHSEYYGWVQDKYGFSWQLMLTNPNGNPRPFIVPCLMFGGADGFRGEEAINYYVSSFDNAAQGTLAKYDVSNSSAKPGSLMYGDFQISGQWFAAMDSAVEQGFVFNEAVSLSVNCKDQNEIDDLWSKLSAHPQNEQCGWCKDKFGVSWQIVPEKMDALMQSPHAFANLMNMKKIVIADFK